MKSQLEAIEERRLRFGVTIDDLERAANVSSSYYYHLRSGKYKPTKVVLQRFKLGLDRLTNTKAKIDLSEVSFYSNTLLRLAVALICEVRGIDAESIQRQDPNRRATASKEWLAGAQIRNEAWALVSNSFGIQGVDIAKGAGVTRAAVTTARKKIENNRDDPEYEQFHDRLERALTGGGW